MKNVHFFPKTIKQLINGKIVDVDFDIEQMIPKFLVDEFGMENIINAIDELKMTYSELTTYVDFTSDSSSYHTNKWHDITRTEFVEKRDTRYNNVIKSYYKYTSHEFSLITRGQELLTKLIVEKFPYLSEFKGVKKVLFDPFEFVNKHTRLQDIPNEFRTYTVNELIEMVGVQEKEIEVNLCQCYTNNLSDFDKYEFYLNCPEIINQYGNVESLYIPYRALTNNDFSMIYNRTKSSLENYHKLVSSYRLSTDVLTCKTALKLKSLMK